jgi:hypothetical protein
MCRQLSRFEDDGGLVVVIAQFCVARRGEGDALAGASLSAVLRAVSADLQGIGTSAFRLLPLPALKDWTT